MSEPILDLESMLNSAERDLLVEGASEFIFPLRRRAAVPDFYERLEEELRAQDILSIVEYRSVKEGFVRLSRPSKLKLDHAGLVRRRPHLCALSAELSSWRREFADLSVDVAIRQLYREMIADSGVTRACFEVLSYLLKHQEEIKGLLPRQVQHSESTKLIGREPLLLRLFGVWRREPASWGQFFRYFELLERPVEFRFYAPTCFYQETRLSDFHGVLIEELAPRYNFSGNAGTLIVENLETFYSEASRSQNQLIVWGCGWKSILLRKIEKRLPRPVLYWGDIDKEGYEIYGHLKSYIPDLEPTLMDRQTIERNSKYSVGKDPYFGPYRSVAELQSEYQEVCQRGLCIEQEKIHDRPY